MAEVSYDVPMGLPDPTLLLLSAQRLVALSESEREEAVQTLFKLIDGVLATPEEPKKRRVKKANEAFHRKLGRHPPGVDFLRAAGFMETDDPDAGEEGQGALLTMPVAYISRLTDAHHTLAQAAQAAGLPAPPLPAVSGGFNPYQSNRQATDTTRSAKAPEQWKSEADVVREEVKRREEQLQRHVEAAPAVDMRPSAFWLSAGRRLEDVIRDAAESDPKADRSADNALLQSQVAASKDAIAGTATKFQNADKRRLQELSRVRVHQLCVLRIICPDKAVLQVTFRAADKGEHVLTQIEPLFAPSVRERPWYLYQSPPLQKLNPRQTLAAAGFTPGASLYLGFEGSARPEPPYLEDSFLEQLGPRPEGARGVNSVTGPSYADAAKGWGTGQRLGEAANASAIASAPASVAAAPAAAAAAGADGAGAEPQVETHTGGA